MFLHQSLVVLQYLLKVHPEGQVYIQIVIPLVLVDFQFLKVDKLWKALSIHYYKMLMLI